MTATTHAHHLLNSLPYKTPLTRPSSSPSTGGLFAFPVALRPWLVLQCRGARFRAKRNVIRHMSETKPPKDAKSMVAVEQLARAGLCPRCYEQVEQGRCPRCFEMQDVGQEPAGEGE